MFWNVSGFVMLDFSCLIDVRLIVYIIFVSRRKDVKVRRGVIVGISER